jgi:antitoxin component HigA of HigAB toxin-antitoxin module
MNRRSEIYTQTMAQIYADQGYFHKAAEIYRHLIKEDPHNPVLHKALDDVMSHLAEHPEDRKADLTQRFSTWIDLLGRYRQLRMMRRMHLNPDPGSEGEAQRQKKGDLK